MSKILLVGASGRLGRFLSGALSEACDQIICHSRSTREAGWLTFEPLDFDDLATALDKVKPNVIVNTAALTDVDFCQAHPAEAFRANALCVENLSKWITSSSPETYLIQISSDHLYGGVGYQREDDISLVNIYAYSKFIGELFAARCPNHLNLRTNFFGNLAEFGLQSFSDWIATSLERQEPVALTSECLFNPVSLDFLSFVLRTCIAQTLIGTYNLGSRDAMSKYDFGQNLARALGCSEDLVVDHPVALSPDRAPRPSDMRMDVSSIEAIMGRMPNLVDLINEVANERSKAVA